MATKNIRRLLKKGDLAGAEAATRSALEQGPVTPVLLDCMGLIHQRLGRYDEAAQCFAEAQRLDPETPGYILRAADLAEAQGNLAAAVADYKRASALCVPRNAIGGFFTFPGFRPHGDEFGYLNPSFALGGEDVMLRKMFKQKLAQQTPGFYVDIGAASAVLGSNTYLFYCYGWRGVCVDPNPVSAYGFGAVRPRDVFVNCAVTRTAEDLFFAMHQSQNAGRAQIARDPAAFGADFQTPTRVPGRPLRDILRENVPAGAAIDFMSIDVEGAEFEVVESNDWDAYAPRVIILEDNAFGPEHRQTPAVDYLAAVGYRIVGWLAPNVYLER